MAERLIDKLCKMTDEDYAKYLIWHNSDSGKTFKELKLKTKEDDCKDWLTSSDGIDCQMILDKHMKNYKLSLLYNTMLDKALGGDVRAASWIESFAKSDYFNDSTDEIDDFMSDVSIPGLE